MKPEEKEHMKPGLNHSWIENNQTIPKMINFTSYSVDDTLAFAETVLNELIKESATSQKDNLATVLVLRGDLGSGKTTFTKKLGLLLGVEEEITSPTFSIEKRYKIKKNQINNDLIIPFDTLIHIDAFRLESAKEILSIDFENTLKNPKNLICFEWPEMVADLDVLPKDSPIIEFEFIDENTRKMFFSPNPNQINGMML